MKNCKRRKQEALTFRSRAYLFSRRWSYRLLSGLRALHQGFWLGILDFGALQELTEHYYRTQTGDDSYFDAKYNLSGLSRWEAAAIDAHFGDCQSVLVGAAGGGREVLAMARRFSRVDAFECNARLVEHCTAFLESQGVSARVFETAPDEVPDEAGIYDGVILGWGAYIHINGRKRRVRFLQELHKHIKPGGPFFLSFFTRSTSMSQRLNYRVARLVRLLRRAQPPELGDWVSESFDRRFTEEEVREELAEAGFEMIFYSKTTYGHAVGRARAGIGEPTKDGWTSSSAMAANQLKTVNAAAATVGPEGVDRSVAKI